MTPTQEQAIRDRLAAVLASPQAPAAIYPIAHAPQDIAFLLDALNTAEAERDALRASHDRQRPLIILGHALAVACATVSTGDVVQFTVTPTIAEALAAAARLGEPRP